MKVDFLENLKDVVQTQVDTEAKSLTHLSAIDALVVMQHVHNGMVAALAAEKQAHSETTRMLNAERAAHRCTVDANWEACAKITEARLAEEDARHRARDAAAIQEAEITNLREQLQRVTAAAEPDRSAKRHRGVDEATLCEEVWYRIPDPTSPDTHPSHPQTQRIAANVFWSVGVCAGMFRRDLEAHVDNVTTP